MSLVTTCRYLFRINRFRVIKPRDPTGEPDASGQGEYCERDQSYDGESSARKSGNRLPRGARRIDVCEPWNEKHADRTRHTDECRDEVEQPPTDHATRVALPAARAPSSTECTAHVSIGIDHGTIRGCVGLT